MSRDDFARHYQSLTDAQLQEIASDWGSLLDDAKAALVEESSRRTLVLDIEETEALFDEVTYRDLVTIRRYRDLSEAIVARAVVESAGIFCFLKDENLVRLDWQLSNLIGGIRLQVSASDVDAAEEVLAQPIPDEISISDQESFEQPRCSRCQSTDISWERQGRKAALLSLHLFSLPSPRGSASWHCNNCGLRWIEEDDPPQATD